jgi:site-specific recombinase XerD
MVMPLRSERSALIWDEAVRSYRLSLQAEDKRRDTLKSYGTSLEQFHAFLVAQNRPTDPGRIQREDVAAFLADLRVQKRRMSGTIATRYGGLKGFFRRLEDEGEIDAYPMARMRRPTVPRIPREVR